VHPKGIYIALKSSVSGWPLQAMPERKGYFNWENWGTRELTRTGSNRKMESEPKFESYPRNHSHRNILLSYCISFDLNAIVFTFFFSSLFLQITVVIIL